MDATANLERANRLMVFVFYIDLGANQFAESRITLERGRTKVSIDIRARGKDIGEGATRH